MIKDGKVDPDPRTQILTDLSRFMNGQRAEGYEVSGTHNECGRGSVLCSNDVLGYAIVVAVLQYYVRY